MLKGVSEEWLELREWDGASPAVPCCWLRRTRGSRCIAKSCTSAEQPPQQAASGPWQREGEHTPGAVCRQTSTVRAPCPVPVPLCSCHPQAAVEGHSLPPRRSHKWARCVRSCTKPGQPEPQHFGSNGQSLCRPCKPFQDDLHH